MQTEQLHIRVTADEAKLLKAQADRCEMSATALGAQLLKAAIRAIRNESGPIVPPAFEFSSQAKCKGAK